ncbi:MAG: hypothetical protein LBJ74_01050 [Heliobacteriaceae bacterium]|jgi:hypothetical protein|nr:hypothetical protein [Heliobacteriaceae bacterium]
MKKIIVILGCLVFGAQGAFAADSLTRMERDMFRRDFRNQSAQTRVERLEERMLGAKQSGDLSRRFDTLQRASRSYGSSYPQGYYQNSQYPYYTQPVTSGSSWRGLAGSFGNFLMGGYPGSVTGMSPQINPSYAMDAFEMQRYGSPVTQGQYVQTNRGYYYNDRQTGTGSKVTILD